MNWFVYLILTRKNKIYTGISTDPIRRFSEHVFHHKGAKYFYSDPPSQLLAVYQCQNKSDAAKLESRIKSLSHQQKLSMIGHA